MALATIFDFATILPIAPEASTNGSVPPPFFHHPTLVLCYI